MRLVMIEYRKWTEETLRWVGYLTSLDLRSRNGSKFTTAIWWLGLPIFYFTTEAKRKVKRLTDGPQDQSGNQQLAKLNSKHALPNWPWWGSGLWEWFWYCLFSVLVAVKWMLIIVPLFAYLTLLPSALVCIVKDSQGSGQRQTPNKKRTPKIVTFPIRKSVTFNDVRARIRELK